MKRTFSFLDSGIERYSIHGSTLHSSRQARRSIMALTFFVLCTLFAMVSCTKSDDVPPAEEPVIENQEDTPQPKVEEEVWKTLSPWKVLPSDNHRLFAVIEKKPVKIFATVNSGNWGQITVEQRVGDVFMSEPVIHTLSPGQTTVINTVAQSNVIRLSCEQDEKAELLVIVSYKE